MLEAQPLHGVMELDIDPEVVRVQLHRVAVAEAALLVDVHRQGGNGAIHAQVPVAISAGIRSERYGCRCDGFGGLERHRYTPPSCPGRAPLSARTRARRRSAPAIPAALRRGAARALRSPARAVGSR